MPTVRVEMWPGRTHAQKAELARVITEALVTIAHTTPDQCLVVFQDVAKEDWAQAGVLASDQTQAPSQARRRAGTRPGRKQPRRRASPGI